MGDFFGKIKDAVSTVATLAASTTKQIKTATDTVGQGLALATKAMGPDQSCDEAYPGVALADQDFFTQWSLSDFPNPAAKQPLNPSIALFAKDFNAFSSWVSTNRKSLFELSMEKGGPLNPVCLSDKGYYIPSWLQALFTEYVSTELDPATYGIKKDDKLKGFIDAYWGKNSPDFWVSADNYPELPNSDLNELQREQNEGYIFPHIKLSEPEIKLMRIILGDSPKGENSYFKASPADAKGLREIAVGTHLDPERYQVWVKFLSYVLQNDGGKVSEEEKLRLGYLLSQFGEVRALLEFVTEDEIKTYLASPPFEKIKGEYLSLYDRYYQKFLLNTPALPLPMGPYLSAGDYVDDNPPPFLAEGEKETFDVLTQRLYPSDLLSLLADMEAQNAGTPQDPLTHLPQIEGLKNGVFRRVNIRGVSVREGANEPRAYAVAKKTAPLFAKILKLKIAICEESKKCGSAQLNQLKKLVTAFDNINSETPESGGITENIFFILLVSGISMAVINDIYHRVVGGAAQRGVTEAALAKIADLERELTELKNKSGKKAGHKSGNDDDDPPPTAGAGASAAAASGASTTQQAAATGSKFSTYAPSFFTFITGVALLYYTRGSGSAGGGGGMGAMGAQVQAAGLSALWSAPPPRPKSIGELGI